MPGGPRRFGRFVGRPPAASRAPFHIICYGNSLTQGWSDPDNYPAALQALRPGDTVENLGTGNQYTDQMLANFDTDVMPLFTSGKTPLCIWWESIDSMNDHGVSASAEYAKLQSAAALMRARGVLCVIPPAIAAKDPPADPALVTTLAGLLRADHSWMDGWCDLLADARLQDPDNATYFQDAGSATSVHLTALGYTGVVAPLLAATLAGM